MSCVEMERLMTDRDGFFKGEDGMSDRGGGGGAGMFLHSDGATSYELNAICKPILNDMI